MKYIPALFLVLVVGCAFPPSDAVWETHKFEGFFNVTVLAGDITEGRWRVEDTTGEEFNITDSAYKVIESGTWKCLVSPKRREGGYRKIWEIKRIENKGL